jgi:hypothetical protein
MTKQQRHAVMKNLFTAHDLSNLLGLDGLTHLLECEGSMSLPAREMVDDQITWKVKDIVRWASMKEHVDFVKHIIDIDDYVKVELCPDSFRTSNIAELPTFAFQAIARGQLTPCTLAFHVREQEKFFRMQQAVYRKFVVGMLGRKLEAELRTDYVLDPEKIHAALSEGIAWFSGNGNGIWLELGATSKRITLRMPNRVCFRRLQAEYVGSVDVNDAIKGVVHIGKVNITFALDHGCKEIDVRKYLINPVDGMEHIRKVIASCVEDYGISNVAVHFESNWGVGVAPDDFRRANK